MVEGLGSEGLGCRELKALWFRSSDDTLIESVLW